MQFDPPLVEGRLIARYKRFLFDAKLEDGAIITGNCPNTGSMLGLTTPGSRIFMSVHDKPTRKYPYQFEMIEADSTLVGVNTGMPNRIAEEAILAGMIPTLAPYPTLAREKRYGVNSRIDILLSGEGLPTAYVEVKNVHFSRTQGLAEFPDTKTERGAKHLAELGDMAQAGHRAVMLYVVQRGDCSAFRICADLDPAYAAAFERARARGVEAYALDCTVSQSQITAKSLIDVA
ncbi:sugar fermentation stimulation protein A [Rhizobium aquaticum]|uniref:Sugar fermentation stimulation protein homolog n=1 Tax=Rhizobium aquaticum TaxID=1549636 RepID=A0ABV2IVR4_9HYPH